MKDWVIPYLKESGEPFSAFSKPYFDKIEKVNFNCLEENKDMLSTFHIISDRLMEKLNCYFTSDKGKRQSLVYFSINFGSVLADLTKDNFDKLCNRKNVLYSYSPTGTEINITNLQLAQDFKINKGEQLQLAIFTHEIPPRLRLISRQIIIHELIRIIEGLNNSAEHNQLAHEKARQWGFEAEEDAADEYQQGKKQRS